MRADIIPGLTIRTTLLMGENQAEFVAMRKTLYQRYKPITPADCFAVEELVAVTHRIQRMRVIIDANIQIEIAHVQRDHEFVDPVPAVLVAQAYRNLCDKSNVLKTANRELTSLQRHYNQLTKLLENRPPSPSGEEGLNPSPSRTGFEQDKLQNEPISAPQSQPDAPVLSLEVRFAAKELAVAAGKPLPDFALRD